MRNTTFAEMYCARHGIPPEAYLRTIFRRALYPHARPFTALIQLFDGDYFAADLDLVQAAGRLRVLSDFTMDAEEFRHHPANRGLLRNGLRLRVSVRRLRALARATLPPSGNTEPSDSGPPFPPPNLPAPPG